MELDKFIQFGCWNNTNSKKGVPQGCITNVMDLLKNYIITEEKKPNFIIVSGDNYYPDKTKKEDGTKTKIIYRDKLMKGFNYLPKDVDLPIYMILGNHDLETNSKKQQLFIENTDTPEAKDCYILQNELASKSENVDYTFCKSIVLKNNTLLLMIDTSMYEFNDKAEKYLPCYNVFFNGSKKISSLQELREYQREIIITEINKTQKINNIIIVGHHPIAGVKYKEGHPQENLEFLDDVPFFRDVLKEIFITVNGLENGNNVKYYYLCSDLHLYQKGLIYLPVSEGKNMTIQQFIVGTGGTKLDTPLPKDIKTEYQQDGLRYILQEETASCGFLECVIDDEQPIFTPKFVIHGGKMSKRLKTVKRKNKKNRTHRRSQTKKRMANKRN